MYVLKTHSAFVLLLALVCCRAHGEFEGFGNVMSQGQNIDIGAMTQGQSMGNFNNDGPKKYAWDANADQQAPQISDTDYVKVDTVRGEEAGPSGTVGSTAAGYGGDVTPIGASIRDKGNLDALKSKYCPPGPLRCNFNSRYRTIDGSCNNPQRPDLGAAHTCDQYFMQPLYGPQQSPRTHSIVTGKELPNARILSNNLCAQFTNSAGYGTVIGSLWGQVIGHDMSLMSSVRKGAYSNETLKCCEADLNNPDCFSIGIPVNDPFYSQHKRTCMSRARALPCNCGYTRTPSNAQTHYLDASLVYGVVEAGIETMITPSGSLKVNKDNLVTDDPNSPKLNAAIGDFRGNSVTSLTVFHVLLVQEHNRIHAHLQANHPKWSTEQLFEESRRILIAEVQSITFGEYVYLVMGPEYVKKYGVEKLYSGYTRYEPRADPSVYVEHMAGSGRFGHSIVKNIVQFYGPKYNIQQTRLLEDSYFQPEILSHGGYESVMRGMCLLPSDHMDLQIVNGLRNYLLRKKGDHFGNDMCAIDIQRGRDTGIHPYTHFVHFCHGWKPKNFYDLGKLMSEKNWRALESNYVSVDDIDLWIGGAAETPLKQAEVGPTFGCMIANQFVKTRSGDRYWFEHGNQPGSFTKAQLSSLRGVRLAKIICENAHMPYIQPSVMYPNSYPGNHIVSCAKLPDLEWSLF